MQNQDLRSSVNTHFFVRQLVLLAVATVPLVPCLELLRLAHIGKTTGQLNWSFLSLLTHLVLFSQVVEVLQLFKTVVFGWTLPEPDIQLAVFLVYFFQEIFQTVFIVEGSFFFELVLQFGVEPI